MVVLLVPSVLLLVSVALNTLLFTWRDSFYRQLNTVRLDPIGLSVYPASAKDDLSTKQPGTTVVVFGDSRAASWPDPGLDQVEFVNRGIGTETSSQAVERFERHVGRLEPEIVLIQIAVNDLKTIALFSDRKASIVAQCKENIRLLVEKSRSLGAKVVLTTVFPLGKVPLERKLFWSPDVAPAVREVNAYIHSLASQDVLVFDAYSILIGGGGCTQPRSSPT